MASIKAQIAKEYLSKWGDRVSSQTLARKMHNENKGVWLNLDSARNAIRYYRGQSGKISRTGSRDRSHFKKAGSTLALQKLPRGKRTFPGWRPYVLNFENALVLPDLHIPYHDDRALELVIKSTPPDSIDAILLNGDFWDCHGTSPWEKDPRKRQFKKELQTCREILKYIRSVYPKAKLIYKGGNHEDWIERYMQVKAPELLDLDFYKIPELLEFDKVGNIEWIGKKQPLKSGQLWIIHGHEYKFNISNPVNPARGYYLRAKCNILVSHHHQSSSHREAGLNGKTIGAWSTGCLCELNPEYMPLNKWNLGFAKISMNRKAGFGVLNYIIYENKIYPA